MWPAPHAPRTPIASAPHVRRWMVETSAFRTATTGHATMAISAPEVFACQIRERVPVILKTMVQSGPVFIEK